VLTYVRTAIACEVEEEKERVLEMKVNFSPKLVARCSTYENAFACCRISNSQRVKTLGSERGKQIVLNFPPPLRFRRVEEN
jgi:hypothetical protein